MQVYFTARSVLRHCWFGIMKGAWPIKTVPLLSPKKDDQLNKSRE